MQEKTFMVSKKIFSKIFRAQKTIGFLGFCTENLKIFLCTKIWNRFVDIL